jgi:7,8-dihydropterin-6-yl-methyl-4-(beta-D-ribofuranosyl)aminobenzene 5'-phosphate synthase
MRIVTLIDNYTRKKGLTAEHGFSVVIETPRGGILFDTGQTGAVVSNAERMGVDLRKIDAVILSHGHYDHTGGLMNALDINPRVPVYLKNDALLKKYKNNGEDIGLPFDPVRIPNPIAINIRTDIEENIFIIPDIPIKYPENVHFRGFSTERGGTVSEDIFSDELFLLIEKDGYQHIITGCSHRGILNIMDAASHESPLPIGTVIGGFHMMGQDERDIAAAIERMKDYRPRRIGVGHCTGIDGYVLMKNAFGAKVFYNYAGMEIEI